MVARAFLIFGMFLALFLVSCQTQRVSEQFPVENALAKHQGEIHPPNFFPDFDAPPILHRSLNPLIADEAMEQLPFPDKVQHVAGPVDFMPPYRRLLALKSRDSVRSEIFDPVEFSKVRKITIEPFQNKTTGPNRDASAGLIMTSQAYRELQDSGRYQVVDPFQSEDILLKTSEAKAVLAATGTEAAGDLTEPLPNTVVAPSPSEGSEAILTGAVTKFVDTYIDRRGQLRHSIASGVAFGAYLVTPQGKVIWGARFIGSQHQNFRDLIKYKGRWLNKEEFSRFAMRTVLKDFHKNAHSTD
ncbi:MAG: hypothetical protein ACE5G9_10380 [Nitrospinales bacterium]